LPLQPLRPLQLRHWSHAALHLAEFATHIPADCSDEVERLSCAARELEESGYERRAEECAIRARRLLEAEHVSLPPVLYLPQVDGGVVSISGPSQGELASWRYNKTPALGDSDISGVLGPEAASEADRVMAALCAVRSRPARRGRAREAAHPLRAGDRAQRDHLEGLLQRGLADRLGRQLHGYEERIYVQLVGRGLDAGGLRVCEQCLLVFEAPRAAACAACRRSPVRPKYPEHLRPVLPDRAAGVRTSVRVVGNRVVGSISRTRSTRQLRYIGTCQCGREFVAEDASRKHCRKCGSGRGRTARHREERASETASETQ